MKNKFALLFLLISLRTLAQQNLVPNPSFELMSQCPFQVAQISFCSSWFNPSSGTPASPDFFSTCQTNLFAGVPQNYDGFQNPHNGNNYVGIVSFASYSPNVREYIETTLSDTLERKKRYRVDFYVSLSDSCSYSCNNIGVFFSDSIVNYTSDTALQIVPQVKNLTEILDDKLNWIKISGTYISHGGEKYITIGNFNNHLNLDTTKIANYYWQQSSYAYYYIDDIAVYTDSLTSIDKQKEINSFSIYPNPVKEVLHFKNLNLQASISLTIENLLGEKLIERKLSENQMNVSDLKPGIYLVKLNDNKGNFVTKFLKE